MELSKAFHRDSFIELNGRERAFSIIDDGSGREILGPFDRIESPWLLPQNITPQFDDGCIILRGKIDSADTVVIAMEPAFQGGSLGEVSGAKICAALELACRDCKNGKPTSAVFLLETGGVRLPEANLGLAAVAEICSAVLELRELAPIVCISAGSVGSFGGMSLIAGLASYVIMTPEGRLGLNGPEVIEQEHGIEEFDSRDRALIWAIDGGEQRYATGLADVLVRDDITELRGAVREVLKLGLPAIHRSQQIQLFRDRVANLNTTRQIEPGELRSAWKREEEK
jgi:malonate decarboxylase beta subunit